MQHYGQPSIVMMSVQEYNRLKSLDAEVIRFTDLPDDGLRVIAEAEIPEQYRYRISDIAVTIRSDTA